MAVYLAKRNPIKIPSADALRARNGLYQLARRFCIVLNQPSLPEQLENSVISSIVMVIRCMAHNPQLCKYGEADNIEDDSKNHFVRESKDGPVAKLKSSVIEGFEGCRWPMRRLCALGTDIRGMRRMYVLKVFLELIAVESQKFIEYNILPILKVALTVKNTSTSPDLELLKVLHEKSEEVLMLIEKKVDSSIFVGAVGKLQQGLHQKKNDKKSEYATLALTDPIAYAVKKVLNLDNTKIYLIF